MKPRLCLKFSIVIAIAEVLSVAVAFAEDKLVFAVDVIRHGDRTSLREIPAVPHRWAEGPGELTATGIQQEYQLGVKRRTEYVDKYQLLASNYTYGTIRVRSTDFDRTLMSAQSFLMGLYPPGTGPALPGSGSAQPAAPCGAQPIPIHTVPIETDALLVPGYDERRLNKLLERYVFRTQEWKAKSAELEHNFQKWSILTGTAITNLFQLKDVGDSVFVYREHGVKLHPGLEAEAQKIIDAGDWVFAESYKPIEIGQAVGDALLREIMRLFEQASRADPNEPWHLRYVLFSAHDSTLSGELSRLGAPLSYGPQYASDLNFLLFAKGSGEFRVEVQFNDSPVMVPAFGGNSCSLRDFDRFVGNN